MRNEGASAVQELSKTEVMFAGHPMKVGRHPQGHAWGDIDPHSPTTGFYNPDGSLWFVMDNKTGKATNPPPELPEEYRDIDLIGLYHAEADKDKRGFCYFIGGENTPIKIGYSVDPVSRLKALQSGSPVIIALLATRPGGEARESAYHHQFAEHRLHGEWFSPHPDILAEIARLSSPSPSQPRTSALGVGA